MWLLVVIVLLVVGVPVITELFRPTPNTLRLPSDDEGFIARLDQGRTYARWYGPRRGPVAVAVHGLSTPSQTWDRIAGELVDLGYRVLVYDLYGRGKSEAPTEPQTMDFHIGQLEALLEHERLSEDLTVLGYSMGGQIATGFAARRPEALRQLVLIAPAGMAVANDEFLNYCRRTKGFGDWLYLAFAPVIFRKDLVREPQAPEMRDIQYEATQRRGYFPAMLSSLRHTIKTDMQREHEVIERADIPVLAVWGGKDDIIPEEARDMLDDWNAGVEHLVIPEAGHGVAYTHAPDIITAFKRFQKLKG